MSDPALPHRRLLADLVREVVTKEDGRYLIYYSWPSADGAASIEPPKDGEARRREEHRPAPPLEPWSSQTEPAVEGDDDV